MPLCEVTFSQGIISDDEKAAIVKRLSSLLLDAEGLEDNPVSRSICLVNLNQSNSMYVGGKLSDTGKIIVKIYMFYDACTDSVKEKLFSCVTKIFIEENKFTRDKNGNNIWCILSPIQKNEFGVGGIPITLELTKKIISSQ